MKGLNDWGVLNNNSRFHFSIHKWASKGILLGMPLRGGNGSRLKEKDKLDKLDRCSSQRARESMAKGLPTAASPDTAFASDDRMSATTEPSRMDPDNTGTADRELCQTNKEAKVSTPESEALSHLGGTVENVNADIAFCNRGEEMTSCSLPESNRSKTIKGNSRVKLFYGDDQQDTVGKTERTGKNGGANSIRKSSVILDAVENIKKAEGRRNCFNIADVGKTSMQGSPTNSGKFGKSKVNGKVKEFVKIFNQDTLLKPRINTLSKSQSCRSKEKGTVKAEDKVSISMNETDENVQMRSMKKEKSLPGVYVMVDDYLEKTAKQDSTRNDQEDCSATKSEKATMSFHLLRVIDSKIRQWSNGKLGNMRSLLSTLQYVSAEVPWTDSGWKPAPLMDIIEGNAVKRSYQKALLCLHPEKLQQKGANLQQKYIAAKALDILQDAWTHFNSLGSG